MKIKLICFNKVNKEYKEVYSSYINKLKNHCDLEIIEINEFDHGDIKSNMTKNEQNIDLKLNDLKDYEVFLLDINSKQYTSEMIANTLVENKNYKGGKACFIIGPSDGFSQDFRKLHPNKISFGLITLPYNLVRIVLLEQIYRGFKISKNQKYHK
ncbi:23S rRNA (pseudouridine(1915)-N(3))-methyltransferase RlmH [Spiroplasma monobiae]|uniref:Ribosomal RNA large subunit methyltransferase H n=1 Tax=Spiroplasma monobiae MQ-1 TaxID=1336748 RepID=A0A2K9LTX5_SPISQ|nr:23S rRNA (pseudouridine(1915)-N(3))-methyltransferase RlmH [Spiroplasma monobiae]AUM62507.1 23S rRNA (pseudouridine1915-N3)-methyltransferase [Spiroplasma monobiae MQ-1]